MGSFKLSTSWGCSSLPGDVDSKTRGARIGCGAETEFRATMLPDTHRLARFLLTDDLLRMTGARLVLGPSPTELAIGWSLLAAKYCCHSLRVAFLRIFQRFSCISYCQELIEQGLANESMMMKIRKEKKRRNGVILPGVKAVLVLHLCSNVLEGLVACEVKFHDGVLVVLPF